MSTRTEDHIRQQTDAIAAAARVLISMVRGAERNEGARSTHGELRAQR